MDYRQEYDKWCNDPYFDDQTREELKAIAGDDKEIEDRFYRTLEFGTAGLRGVIGAGTNRMNIYTVRQATQGLANYILAQGGQEKGVAIAHDSRLMADEFTDAAALCLAANGIKTYVFKSLRPVPELSFAVRTLGCIAGIVITASHNPREYNGYKVYWEDGAQVTPPHDTGIMAEVAKVTTFDMVKTMEKEKAQAEGLYQIISDDVDESYFAELRNLSIHPEIIKKMAKDIKIVYTPLHGTGLGPVKRVLSDLGFENVYIEPQQAVADGHFPTAPYPNPENPDAWELALKLAKEKDADLVLATDPDADRLGVYCKDTKSGEYVTFTGNMSAMLIAEYILGQKRANNSMPENPVLVESIVSTDMANQHGVPYTLVADNAGGQLMQQCDVDLVIVGADRITRRGDVANKIGTYLKALAAVDNEVPFYVAAPSSTIDWTLNDGKREIPIENRAASELLVVNGVGSDGETRTVQIAAPEVAVANPAFDVTHNRFVTGIITERGIVKPTDLTAVFADLLPKA